MKDFKVYQASGYLTKLVTDASNVRKMYEEISGSLVQFDTPISAPLESLIVDINPVQDLHGQDAPYPAGGGVNKLNVADLVNYDTTYGLTTSLDGDWIVISGTYTASGAAANFRIATLQSKAVFPATKFVAFPDAASANNISSNAFGLADGNKTLTIYLRNMVKNQSYNLKVKIVCYDGDTAPTSWSPYSNICPITGWTGATVEHTGANILDNTGIQVIPNNLLIARNTGYGSPILLRKGITYTFFCNSATRPDGIYLIKPFTATNIYIASSVDHITVTPTEDVSVGVNFYWVTSRPNDATALCCVVGSTATDYEPYSGTTLSVTFPDSAGTVYGGTVDLVSGVLTVDRAEISVSEKQWSYYRGGFYTSVQGGTNVSPISDKYKTAERVDGMGNVANWEDYTIMASTDGAYIYIKDTRYESANEFTTAEGDTAICYELATPTEIQLTPQEINTLIGVNNIWADTGDVSVKYRTH